MRYKQNFAKKIKKKELTTAPKMLYNIYVK